MVLSEDMTTTLLDAAFLAPRYCGPRTIAATVFDRRLVSTVRLTGTWPIGGKEYPYETMLFDRNGQQDEAWHYMTRAEAKRGHWAVCLMNLQSQ